MGLFHILRPIEPPQTGAGLFQITNTGLTASQVALHIHDWLCNDNNEWNSIHYVLSLLKPAKDQPMQSN